MKNYGKIISSYMPDRIKINTTTVEVAENIQPFSQEIEDVVFTGYQYDYIVYDVTEYIKVLDEKNTQLENTLLDTQSALCDLYEAVII